MLSFKRAIHTDIQTIRNLANNIWKVSYREMISAEQIEYMLNWMYSSETIEREMNDGVIWELIEQDNTPVGFIAITPSGSELKLNKLYIDPNLQGKGIGQQALKHVIDYGKNSGYKTVYLTVNKGNSKAIKAYSKAGFVCTGSNVFDIGGGYVMDDYIYTRVL